MPNLRCPRNGQMDEESIALFNPHHSATERFEHALGKAMGHAISPDTGQQGERTARMSGCALVMLMRWRGCWREPFVS